MGGSEVIIFHNVDHYEEGADGLVAVCVCGHMTPPKPWKPMADHYHAAHVWVAEPYSVA